jgi:hypothetical protein
LEYNVAIGRVQRRRSGEKVSIGTDIINVNRSIE